MGLVAGRDLQDRGLDLDEAPAAEPAADGVGDPAARQQERPAVGMDVAASTRAEGDPARGASPGQDAVEWLAMTAQNQYVARRYPGAATAAAGRRQVWRTPVKVIASSLRKGNIVEIDGRLYVVMTAENIHPGKGTPVTQLDMRRISDGVKVSQRYKTTEQVERAHVEDREYQYLYSDGDGVAFHEHGELRPDRGAGRRGRRSGRLSAARHEGAR